MDRVFLDANVLFSAAYREDSVISKLWNLKNVELFTSVYTLEEARRNLKTDERIDRLEGLVKKMKVETLHPDIELPPNVNLPDKDLPVLVAAIHSGCSYLLTGDQRHFGEYFGKKVSGVLIMTPGDFIRKKSRRL